MYTFIHISLAVKHVPSTTSSKQQHRCLNGETDFNRSFSLKLTQPPQ